MTIRTNEDGVLEADFFGMKAKTNKKAAMFAFMPGEGELDYVEEEGEPDVWTALVFDTEETAVLRRVVLAAQKMADDQEAANLAIRLVDFLDALENFSEMQEGQAISEDEAKARWAPEGS